MASNAPKVEPVTLKLGPVSGFAAPTADVTTDYGTPNLLFFYYVPFLPDDIKADLDAIHNDFSSWNAWELRQAEVQVDTNVKSGKLPSDDSAASRVARSNYRSKAVDFFRTSSESWLTLTDTSKTDKVAEATPENVHGSMLKQLRLITEENKLPSQCQVMLNIVSGTIDLNQENKFFFTHVSYNYDGGSKKFVPVVTQTTFTVKKQAGDSSGKGSIKIDITLVINHYRLDLKFWRENQHEGEDAIQKGKPILAQMALELYAKA